MKSKKIFRWRVRFSNLDQSYHIKIGRLTFDSWIYADNDSYLNGSVNEEEDLEKVLKLIKESVIELNMSLNNVSRYKAKTSLGTMTIEEM